jgi:hypothetical protein
MTEIQKTSVNSENLFGVIQEINKEIEAKETNKERNKETGQAKGYIKRYQSINQWINDKNIKKIVSESKFSSINEFSSTYDLILECDYKVKSLKSKYDSPQNAYHVKNIIIANNNKQIDVKVEYKNQVAIDTKKIKENNINDTKPFKVIINSKVVCSYYGHDCHEYKLIQ